MLISILINNLTSKLSNQGRFSHFSDFSRVESAGRYRERGGGLSANAWTHPKQTGTQFTKPRRWCQRGSRSSERCSIFGCHLCCVLSDFNLKAHDWESKQGFTANVLLLASTVPSVCVRVCVAISRIFCMRRLMCPWGKSSRITFKTWIETAPRRIMFYIQIDLHKVI